MWPSLKRGKLSWRVSLRSQTNNLESTQLELLTSLSRKFWSKWLIVRWPFLWLPQKSLFSKILRLMAILSESWLQLSKSFKIWLASWLTSPAESLCAWIWSTAFTSTSRWPVSMLGPLLDYTRRSPIQTSLLKKSRTCNRKSAFWTTTYKTMMTICTKWHKKLAKRIWNLDAKSSDKPAMIALCFLSKTMCKFWKR